MTSRFGNPAASALEDAQAYSAALLELLGDRDPLVVLAEMPGALRKGVAGLDAEELATPEAPGKWSVLQLLDHLFDSELVGSFRYRMVLAQHQPTLPGYDQDAWVERLHPPMSDPAMSADTAVRRFTMLRETNLALLEASTTEDRQRIGLHSERGEESLDRITRLYAGHDLVHRRQLDRIRAAVSQS